MEIFGMGFGEILLIALVALIVVGPERLPEAARTIGKGIAEIRRAVEPAQSVWRDISTELNSVTATTNKVLNSPPTRTPRSPETIHPVLEMMSEEEKAAFMAGGDMPPRITEQLTAEAAMYATNANGSRDAVELPHIHYDVPHAEVSSEVAPTLVEDLYYPAPDEGEGPRQPGSPSSSGT